MSVTVAKRAMVVFWLLRGAAADLQAPSACPSGRGKPDPIGPWRNVAKPVFASWFGRDNGRARPAATPDDMARTTTTEGHIRLLCHRADTLFASDPDAAILAILEAHLLCHTSARRA